MIVMRIKGGLGNQLFQYSAAYALSKRLHQSLKLDPYYTKTMTPREFRLCNFKIKNCEIIDNYVLPKEIRVMRNVYVNKLFRIFNCSVNRYNRNFVYYLETKNTVQDDFFTIDEPNIYLHGYFQSEEYFKKYRLEIIDQFTPSYKMSTEYCTVLSEIVNSNSVAIHVRRGDFKKSNSSFHYLLDRNYYNTAIKYIEERTNSPLFFWFSDDMEWVKNQIGNKNNFVFIKLCTEHNDIDEMMLMKDCKHIITANSTFSWWSAWLNTNNHAIRIVPEKPFGIKKMIPKNWIKI